ncbi:MAG: hypothetical protein AAF568_07160, partial [Pseudomonadota bacterium]
MRSPMSNVPVMALVVVLAGACAQEPQAPDLEVIYSRVTEASDGDPRRPLITVPGTLGSRLIDSETGTLVWGGGSRGLSADPDDPVEAALIALPILEAGTSFDEHRDGVRPAGVLDTAEADVLGLKVKLEVYSGVRNTLSLGGFQLASGGPDRDLPADPEELPAAVAYEQLSEEAENAFRFDYDWRRDLASLAQDFHQFLMQRRQFVADRRSIATGDVVLPEDIRFDLLAHSMGGLITRYYLMHGPAPLGEDGALPPVTWEGAEFFDRVIIVATPNAGSIIAMDNLINGKELGPFQPVYSPTLLGTHPSTWQLMPRARHRRVRFGEGGAVMEDPYDPDLWERFGWGMAGPTSEPMLSWLMPDEPDPAERRRKALAHQARMLTRAERFHAAMDRPWGRKPDHLDMFLVVGGGFQTSAEAVVDPGSGAFTITGVEEGDGVVLRASVLLDERQGGAYTAGLNTPLRFDTVLFLPDEHVELTKNPVFGDNLLFWLLAQPRDRRDLALPDGSLLATATQAVRLPDLGGVTT